MGEEKKKVRKEEKQADEARRSIGREKTCKSRKDRDRREGNG